MFKNLLAWTDDFLSLVYPRLCMACGNSLFLNEDILCTRCLLQLPQTGFHRQAHDNQVVRSFWGRVPVEGGAARYFFRKSAPVQRLLHNLKYNHAPEIGILVGRIYGRELMESEIFRSVDVVVPIPLHPDKEKKRGYNQAAMFARGLAQGMGRPVDEKTLYRAVFTETQTRKSRLRRWENVRSVFALRDTTSLQGKHILLVDDVITTGATMEACILKLLEIPGTRVSVAAIATAGRVV